MRLLFQKTVCSAYKFRVISVLLFYLFVNNIFSVVNSEIISQACVCSGVPCERNVSSTECSSGRVTLRPDCSCCSVCAKQLTDNCNHKELPCDKDFGLICGTDNKCQAEKPCVDDTECSNDRFCFGGACADPCYVSPNVCEDNGPINGICVVRNHRALCSCPQGHIVADAKNECILYKEDEKEAQCHKDGRTLYYGEKAYFSNCGKLCECVHNGEVICHQIEDAECKKGFIPMSSITGEMTESCKTLIGKDTEFDGCCIPQSCQNVTSQENQTDGKRFRLSEAHNNLGEDEEHSSKDMTGDDELKHRPREMFSKVKDHKVGVEPIEKQINSKNSFRSDLMKVAVSKTTVDSAAVILPLHDKTAILSIALSSQLKSSRNENVDESKAEHDQFNNIWKEHRIPPGLPSLTLADLLPDTSYTLKYSVDDKVYPTVEFHTAKSDGEDDALNENEEKSTERINDPKEIKDEEIGGTGTTEREQQQIETMNKDLHITTNDSSTHEDSSEQLQLHNKVNSSNTTTSITGCLYNGTLHDYEAIVYEECDQKCECQKTGEMKCMERCSVPFFKKGSFAHDPLCFEEPSGIDDCCVLVACARNSHAGDARELSLNPCDSVKCGANADCISPSNMGTANQDEETLCVCKEGFLGDPYDEAKGCETAIVTSTSSSSMATSTSPQSLQTTMSNLEKKTEGCVSNNRTYSYGEEHLDGCSYKCHCEVSGEFLCLPRCSYRKDDETEIPIGCHIEKDQSDPDCCETLVCSGDNTNGVKKEKAKVEVPTDGCHYKNKTYEKDEKFHDGCEQQCMCYVNGDVTCQPRCPPSGPTTMEKDCISLPDPLDSCCTVTVCGNQTISDVMREQAKLTSTERSARLDLKDAVESTNSSELIDIKITMVLPINDSSILVSIKVSENELAKISDKNVSIFYTMDQSLPLSSWGLVETNINDLFVEGSDELHTIISGLNPEKEYFFKIKINGSESNIGSGFTRNGPESSMEDHSNSEAANSMEDEMNHSGPFSSEAACKYKDKMFAIGEEFYDGCEEFCACEENGEVKCYPYECPTDFGLEILDSHCVKWEPTRNQRELAPPYCCPEMKCVQNSTCFYEGQMYTNFQEIPQTITGCEKRCYCEYGNVTCQNACPNISETPPTNLPCPPTLAIKISMPHDDCCQVWVCRGQENQTHFLGSKDGIHLNQTTDKKPVPTLAFNITDHTRFPQHNFHDAEEEDQFVPPITVGKPSIIPPENLHPHQLQELLHHLTGQGQRPIQPNHHLPPTPPSEPIYITVKRPQEIRELERIGAKVVAQKEDGTFLLALPPQHRLIPHHPPFPQRPPPPGPDMFPFGPPPFPHHPQHRPNTEEITGVNIRPINESTLHIDFTVSPVLVGLHGAVEVLYTNEFGNKPNPDQWERQLFQQPEDIIDNSHLQLFLTGLQPNAEYHIQIQVIMSDVHNAPISDIFVIRTPAPAPPPEIKIDPELKVQETTSHTAQISWRKFTDFETSLIDGVQIRYKAYDNQLYDTTELIHRSISSYKLTNLQPGTKYEVDLSLIPFANQTTELKSENPIHIETPAEIDDYSFTIAIEAGKVTKHSAEIILEGVPFPEDKFITIYQVIYQTDQKEQKDYFKVASRESNKKAILTALKPGTRYRMWVEAFLTNGKKKRSNVIDVQTKVGLTSGNSESDQENNLTSASRSQDVEPESNSYYGAIVALAIVAAVSVIGVIMLLIVLIKKQSQSKIPINDRKSESSYDNPSFKNYDVEANGHNHNKPNEL